MVHKLIKICIFAAVLLLFTPPAYATDVISRSFDQIDRRAVEDAVPDEARRLLGDTELDESLDFGESVRTLVRRAWDAMRDHLAEPLRGGAKLFAIAVLCALTAVVLEDMPDGVRIAGTLAVVLLVLGDVDSLLGLGRRTVEEIAVFGRVLMPVLAAAGVASGAVTSSGVVYTAVLFVIDILLTLIAEVMTPLVWAYIALLTAGGATGNSGLLKLAKTLKTAVSGILKIVLSLFVGYLMVGGVISGTTDAMAVKTVKLTLSSVIPVAGGVIADAAEAVVAGAGIVRSAAGVFGVLSVLAMVIVPFLRLALQALVYRAAALLAGVVGTAGLDPVLEGLGDAFSLTLGLTGTSAALLLIGIFAAAAGVTL